MTDKLEEVNRVNRWEYTLMVISVVVMMFNIQMGFSQIRRELDKKIYAPAQGLQVINIKMLDSHMIMPDGRIINEPIYQLLALGQNPEEAIVKE